MKMKTSFVCLLLSLFATSADQIITNICAWDTTKLTNGWYTIQSIAWDAAGNSCTSAPVLVHVLNELFSPSVKLITPTPQATVKGRFLVQAEVSDDVGVVRSDLLIDSRIVSTSTNTPTVSWTWSASSLSKGWHTLEVRAWDASGKHSPYAAIGITR